MPNFPTAALIPLDITVPITTIPVDTDDPDTNSSPTAASAQPHHWLLDPTLRKSSRPMASLPVAYSTVGMTHPGPVLGVKKSMLDLGGERDLDYNNFSTSIAATATTTDYEYCDQPPATLPTISHPYF